MAAERMNDSILVSIKKMLGLPDEYDAFDLDSLHTLIQRLQFWLRLE